MKTSVPDLAIPQDNVLFAFLYSKMKDTSLNIFLLVEILLCSIFQRENSYKASDVVNIKDIIRRFGTKPINILIFLSTIQSVLDNKLLHIETPRALNYID